MAKTFREASESSLSETVYRLLILAAALAACIYLIHLSVCEFLRFEVITRIQVVSDYQTQFPKVTICGLTAFTTNHSAAFLARVQSQIPHNASQLVNKYMPLLIANGLNETDKQKLGYSIQVNRLSQLSEF